MRLSVSDWDVFTAAGWSAKFFDAPTGGTDITAQITGPNGWQVALSNAAPRQLRVEASAPATAVVGASQTLTLRAEAGATGEVPAIDVVKAIYNVVNSAQPDVAIGRLNEDNLVDEWIGQDQFSPAAQKIAAVWGVDETQKFAVQITNKSSGASSFELAELAPPDGWTARFYDALQGGNLLQAGQSGIATPLIEPNASLKWRLELTATAPALRANLAIGVSGGSLSDEVAVDAAMQSLVGIEWSRDGETWTAVTTATKLQSERYQSLGFRGLKAVPDVGWPRGVLGPTWQWQGARLEGEKVWLSPRRVTDANGETAQATLGNSFEARMVVLPDVDLFLRAARGVMVAGATVAISIESKDEHKAALPGLRVRLRSRQNGADSGHFGQSPPGDVFVVTDAAGRIDTTWTAPTGTTGKVQISVEAVDGAGQVFGEGDTWNMEVTN